MGTNQDYEVARTLLTLMVRLEHQPVRRGAVLARHEIDEIETIFSNLNYSGAGSSITKEDVAFNIKRHRDRLQEWFRVCRTQGRGDK